MHNAQRTMQRAGAVDGLVFVLLERGGAVET